MRIVTGHASSPRGRRGRTLAALVLIATLVGGTAFALASSLGNDKPDGPFPTHPQAAEVDPRLKDSFGVLRRDRLERDTMEPADSARLGRANPNGANPAFSRLAIDRNGFRVFVIPADEGACIYAVAPSPAGGGGGTCASTEATLAGRAFIGALSRGGIRLTGIVPDGVRSITISLQGGSQVSADVEANAYTIEVDQSTESVSFEIGDDVVTLPFPFQKVPIYVEENGEPQRVP